MKCFNRFLSLPNGFGSAMEVMPMEIMHGVAFFNMARLYQGAPSGGMLGMRRIFHREKELRRRTEATVECPKITSEGRSIRHVLQCRKPLAGYRSEVPPPHVPANGCFDNTIELDIGGLPAQDLGCP